MAGVEMGDAWSQGAFPPSRLLGRGAGRDRTGSASIVFFDANGSMHNLSSALLTLSNHLCSGEEGMGRQSFLFQAFFCCFLPKVFPKCWVKKFSHAASGICWSPRSGYHSASQR